RPPSLPLFPYTTLFRSRQHGLAEVALDVVLLSVPEATVREDGGLAGFEPGFGTEELGGICLGAAREALVVEPGRTLVEQGASLEDRKSTRLNSSHQIIS